MKKIKMMKKICQVLLLLVCGGQVAVADLYTVSDIPITAELSSANEARTAAIRNGETDAFWALMKKMVSPENLQSISGPSEDEIVDWVQHVSLADEKNTATKYMATLTVRFREDKVQAFLTAHQIPFLRQELPSAVVVPVFEKEEKILTLDDQNPWYAYLKTASISDERIVVPTGELEDLMWVQEALNNQDMSILKNLSEKYETESVFVLGISDEGSSIRIRTRYVPTEPILETEKYVAKSGSDSGNLIPGVWAQVLADRKELWNRVKMQNFESAMTFWVQVPIAQLSEWQGIRRKLEKADFLENFMIRGFRPGEVWISWQYKGTSLELNRQLRALGLYLDVGDMSGVWVLTKRQNGGDA